MYPPRLVVFTSLSCNLNNEGVHFNETSKICQIELYLRTLAPFNGSILLKREPNIKTKPNLSREWTNLLSVGFAELD